MADSGRPSTLRRRRSQAGLGLVTVACWALATPALAQAPAETTPGVIAYPPAFFADARPASALDMVRRLPGFAYDPGDTDVRGFAGAAGNVLVDGQRPSAKTTSLDDILSRIPPEAVARIDLVRTAASGIDMQGRAVVANVVRRTEAAVAGAAELGAKATGSELGAEGRLEWSRRQGALSLDGAIAFEREEDFASGEGRRVRRTPTGAVRTSDRYLADYEEREVSGSASAAYRRDADVLRLNLSGGYERNDRLDRFSGAALEQTLTRTVETVGEIGLDYERQIDARLTARVLGLQRLGREEETSASSEPGETETSDETATTGETIFRTAATYRASGRLTLDAGLEGAFNVLEARSGVVKDGAPIDVPNANVRVEERRGEVFATANLSLTERVDLQIGARHEVSSIGQSGDTARERSFSFFKPRALATYSHGQAQARLRLERQVGQLDFGDFAASSELESGTITAGNAELEPERWWVAELTLERRFWDKGAVVASVRREWVQEAVDRIAIFTSDGVFEAPGNIGDAIRDVATLNVALPLDRLGISGGLLKVDGTWRRSAVDDPLTGARRALSWQRPFEGDISLSRDMPAINSTVTLSGHLGWRETDYRLREIRVEVEEPLLTLNWDWKPRPDVTVRAQVENLLGRERRRERALFAGARAGGVVREHEILDARRARTLMLRIRKTL